MSPRPSCPEPAVPAGDHADLPRGREVGPGPRLKTHQICTVVLPTKTGQTLRIRKAATPEKDVAELYRQLGIPDHVINPIHRCTDFASQ